MRRICMNNTVNEMPREFYKADTMLRYNPLWALILGERSVGKSFEFKRRSITTPNSIWVYLRRSDVLRKDPKNWKSYLSDLLQQQVIDLDAEYKVNSEGLWVDGIQKVIFSALSTDSSAHSMNYLPDSMQETAQVKVKSKKKKQATLDTDDKREQQMNFDAEVKEHSSFEARRIDDAIESVQNETRKPINIAKKIVFEEILEPKNRYIKNEVEQLFEFYVTVDRYTNTQLFGIANLMTSYNPYFDYFGVRPFKEEFKWFKNKTLLVQNVKLKAMEDFVKQQRFYNLVEGTDYADYLTNNTPWQDDNFGIVPRPPKSKAVYNFRMHNELFGIWEYEDIYYVSKKNNPQLPVFAGIRSFQDGDFLIKKGEYIHKFLNYCVENNIIRFDSIPIRDVVYEIINGGFREA